CSASAAAASASTRAARWASTRRVTRGWPAATFCPLSKCTCSTISLTLALRVTDSRARTVPRPWTVSLHGRGWTTAVVTGIAAPPPRAAGAWRSQPASASSPHRSNAGIRAAIDRLAGFMRKPRSVASGRERLYVALVGPRPRELPLWLQVQCRQHPRDQRLRVLAVGVQVHLGCLRRLVGRVDPGEVRDQPGPGLAVQTLDVARLGHFQRHVHEHL